MQRLALALIAILCLSAGPVLSTAGEVTLIIDDEAGVPRTAEPVTMGIPLPAGEVSDVSQLALLDASGQPVPCQFTEVARHLDGKSVKWVHATWLATVPRGGQSKVRVVTGKGAAPAGLSVEQADGKVTVQTGCVKFVLSGRNFKGIESAWFDPTGKNNYAAASQVVGGEGGGSHLATVPADGVKIEDMQPVASAKPSETTSAADAASTVTVEESGPGRAVVRVHGHHVGEAGKSLEYIVRYYAYAGSPIVRVSHTFVGDIGTQPADHVWMTRLDFDTPTTLAGGKVTVGTEGEPLESTAPAGIHQMSSDAYAIQSNTGGLLGGKGKSTKPLTTGWVDLAKGDLGLAVGVKWFWQMFPKKITATEAGLLSVSLYPAGSRPLEVYMGQSRTHYMTYIFHDGKTTRDRLNELFAAEQRPLRAWAPPKHYARDTMAFGPMAELDKALFAADDWAKVVAHNDVMLKSVNMLMEKIDGNEYNGVSRDSYGIYAWGDRFHWGWPKMGNSPHETAQWKQSWAGNYYDYPNAMILAFLRTGEKRYLDRFFPNAVQVGDVHTANYHSKKQLFGACRYCPPRNFVSTDDGTPYISNEFNHYKSQSVFAHWYLTGDRRSLDHCELLANNALTNRAADRGWAARGIGAQMAGLWNAYELWRDPQYLARLKGLADQCIRHFSTGKYPKGGDFMWGIANEGLCYYYWVSGDQRVVEALKTGMPKCKAKTAYPNMALANAMTYRLTGDEQFKEWAWRCLGRLKPSSRVHGPGTQFRGNANALFFLSDASKDWKPYSGPPADGKHEPAAWLFE